MEVEKKPKEEVKAREKIIEAALDLFYYKGYKGTTIREIAQAADVNLALISYYFGGKKGLVEHIMIQFYEGYFRHFEDGQLQELMEGKQESFEKVWTIVKSSFDYLFQQYKMTRFIYRELTIDSMLVREVMTLYLTKEKYHYLTLFQEIKKRGELGVEADVEMIVLQLLNLLYMPFLQPQVIREVYYMEPLDEQFKERYLSQLKEWIRLLFQQKADSFDPPL